MKKILRIFLINSFLVLSNLSTANALEPSLVMECNEDASVVSAYQSFNNFGKLGGAHEGWALTSTSQKLRTQTVPYFFKVGRVVEQTCRVGNMFVKIEIRRFERNSVRDECTESTRLSVTADGKKIFDDIPFGFSGCFDEDINIERIYISLVDWAPKNISHGLNISGSLQAAKTAKILNSDSFLFAAMTDRQFEQVYKTRKRIVTRQALPLNNSNFSAFFKYQE